MKWIGPDRVVGSSLSSRIRPTSSCELIGIRASSMRRLAVSAAELDCGMNAMTALVLAVQNRRRPNTVKIDSTGHSASFARWAPYQNISGVKKAMAESERPKKKPVYIARRKPTEHA